MLRAEEKHVLHELIQVAVDSDLVDKLAHVAQDLRQLQEERLLAPRLLHSLQAVLKEL